jgi:LCP family protein required for cell wall assembly
MPVLTSPVLLQHSGYPGLTGLRNPSGGGSAPFRQLVRTTLKRGHGRTALDGNGSGRSTLPPDALSAMTLYEAEPPPPKSRLRRIGKGFAWVLLVLVMLGAAFGGGFYLWLHEAAGALNDTTPEGQQAKKYLAVVLPHHAVIALVLGYDHRAGQGNAPSRSDSMMLLRLDPATHTVSMLSLPRDLAVTIHGPPNCRYAAPHVEKINAAYSECGPSGSLLTVSAATGLPINYLIRVNFAGFKKVVNTLGGVWVDVDRRYFNRDTGPYGYAAINLQPGYQRLTGGSALDFVRFRHTDSDIYRVARQQLFVQAMKEQLKQSFDVQKALAIIQAASDNVQVGIGGGKKVDLNLVLSWGRFIYDLPGGHFCQAKIEDLTGASDLTASQDSISSAVQQFTTPCSVRQAKDANTVALGGKLKQTVPKPAETSVLVLNGNGKAGSAANLSFLLAQRGYRMLQPAAGKTANAPAFGYGNSKVYYLPWSKRGKAAAGALAQLLAPADAAPIPRNLMPLRGTSMLLVIVGNSFQSLTPPPAQPVIAHVAPNVAYNRSATESLVRDAQRQVPFSLMVPNVLESSSSPDSVGGDVPIRVYDIADKHKAVRLVFRRGGVNEYWGVQETDWQDAPILAEKSFHRVIGGRSYDFYYHGQHLHMVVLHRGKTDYWVVNTLVDSLSNETLIAIAKGLQPLNQAKVSKASGRK